MVTNYWNISFLQVENGDDDDEDDTAQVVYRNACSDMLDYGQTEVFENEEEKRRIKYDNSGVFEYAQQQHDKKKLYKCECSDSNSSLDSGGSDTNANKVLLSGQAAKSNSCECIGFDNGNNSEMLENCYYSEPNIMDDYNKNSTPPPTAKKSVWSKEKKPKSSCLKKTKYTNVILPEHDLNKKMKKFNVHQLTDQIFDNKTTIIGSLKDIFGMAMTERGVPEGSEDLQPVVECLPDTPLDVEEEFTVIAKPKSFLSKSLDGVNRKNAQKFVHNVDEQLRGAKEEDLYAPTRKNSQDSPEEPLAVTKEESYRNKYIINCESTVFEHTGVSFVYNSQPPPIEEQKAAPTQGLQLKQKISNIFGVFTSSNPTSPVESVDRKIVASPPAGGRMDSSMTSSCSDKNSVFSDATTSTKDTSQATSRGGGGVQQTSPKRKHLQSPMHNNTKTVSRSRMSPDLFNYGGSSSGSQRNIPAILSEEFDDILTITTTDTEVDKDLVIVDYPTAAEKAEPQYLRPPMSTSSSKTSLINRFLRNVTQKKILEATIKKNNFFQAKLSSEKKLFGNLYLKGVKQCSKNMIEDMNAEIAMEIETSVRRQSSVSIESTQFDGGVGEISIETFDGHKMNILRSEKEILMKAFKLYTGYSREGYLTPILVFLTDKTLYVTDVVRNRLSSKFVLPYAELDVILMGPFGNTVLLSNSARDMQQVLLAGGPYPADGLVASLELCARRGGSTLPAIGQLTLDHLAPLQAFVRHNSSVSKEDVWKYYAVVNVPAGSLSDEKEPLGPYLKGFLMHRSLSHSGFTQQWAVGYFLLK